MVRRLVPKPQYSCELVDEGRSEYIVTKIGTDDEEEAKYNVRHGVNAKSSECECYAGLMGKFCRHKQIVDLFVAHDKVGSVATYCFDRKTWQ